MADRFYNNLKQRFETDAVQPDPLGRSSRWYIKVGFAGFNSTTNNFDGYATRELAEAAIIRYQKR